MRIDSCRRCGTLPVILQCCKTCKQPIELQCKQCQKLEDKTHVNCDLEFQHVVSC